MAKKENLKEKLLEAKEKLDSLKLPEPEKQEYKRYLENLRYQASMVGSSYNSGRVEGEQIGIEKEKSEIAKKMKLAGIENEVIQQITGLSIDEIIRL